MHYTCTRRDLCAVPASRNAAISAEIHIRTRDHEMPRIFTPRPIESRKHLLGGELRISPVSRIKTARRWRLSNVGKHSLFLCFFLRQFNREMSCTLLFGQFDLHLLLSRNSRLELPCIRGDLRRVRGSILVDRILTRLVPRSCNKIRSLMPLIEQRNGK